MFSVKYIIAQMENNLAHHNQPEYAEEFENILAILEEGGKDQARHEVTRLMKQYREGIEERIKEPEVLVRLELYLAILSSIQHFLI